MEELNELKEIVKSLEFRLELIKERKEKAEKELKNKGYSLKKINGYTYIYIWYELNGKTRWRSLGNIEKNERVLERIGNTNERKILKKLQDLEGQEKKIKELIKKIIEIYNEHIDKYKEVVR